MSKARLDLRGIDLTEIRSKRSRRKGLHIESQPTIEVIETRPGIPYKYICICFLIMCICFISIHFSFEPKTMVKKSVHKSSLRKMIRMNCRSRKMVTYCTTNQNQGDYVVSINNCKDIFEFNGIPFTDVYKDKNGNYRVPSSMDHTLRIKDHCNNIAATVDTNEQSYEEYASNHPLSPNDSIEKIVWVTDTCYTDFTLSIDNEHIYEKTPASMITSYPLEKKIAYVYETDGGQLKGGINIEGTGCDQPIYIYTKKY
jgi:hypothetical protein